MSERLVQFLYHILRDCPEVDVKRRIDETSHGAPRYESEWSTYNHAMLYAAQLIGKQPEDILAKPTVEVFAAESVSEIVAEKNRVPSANDSWVRYEDYTAALGGRRRFEVSTEPDHFQAVISMSEGQWFAYSGFKNDNEVQDARDKLASSPVGYEHVTAITVPFAPEKNVEGPGIWCVVYKFKGDWCITPSDGNTEKAAHMDAYVFSRGITKEIYTDITVRKLPYPEGYNNTKDIAIVDDTEESVSVFIPITEGEHLFERADGNPVYDVSMLERHRRKFYLNDRVHKCGHTPMLTGRVVGMYSTEQTPSGYVVQFGSGAVQNFHESDLELAP